jgi:hypothetical protein
VSLLPQRGVSVIPLTKVGSLTRSHSFAETTSHARSPKYTAFMKNVSRNTETPLSGSLAVKSSTSLPLLLSLMVEYSVFTVVSRPKSEHLIRFALSPARKRFLTRVHSVTLCGPIRKTSTHGRSRLEVQAGSLAKRCLQRYASTVEMFSLPSLLTSTSQFNHVNNLQLIARAHQLVNEGYKYHFQSQEVVTVWSAPNYCYRCGNVASIMTLGEDLEPDFKIFSAVPDHRRAVPAGRRGAGEYFL